MSRWKTLIAAAALLSAGGCGGKKSPAGEVQATSGPDKRADKVWFDSCQSCHGAKGLGNGAAARNLNPKPRSLDDPAWQKRTTDDQIRRVITKGGAAVGLSPSMPATPTLIVDKPALKALVTKIRNFAK